MKAKYLLISLMILLVSHSFAQEKDKADFNSIISVSTFSPIISYVPRWNIGYIRKVDERFWLGLELGYGNKDIAANFANNGIWFTNNYKSFEIKPEFYYNLNPKAKEKQFLSLEFQYVQHTDKFSNTWYYDQNGNTYYDYDSAAYKRRKYAVNLNYSIIVNITKNLALMPKVGLGYRKRVVQYSDIVNRIAKPSFEEEGFILPDFNGFLRDNGNAGGLNFNLDLKIMYRW